MKPAEIKIGKTYRRGDVQRTVLKMNGMKNSPPYVFYRECVGDFRCTDHAMLDTFAKWAEEVVDVRHTLRSRQ